EPRPADVTEVSRARLVAAVGVGYDDWVVRVAAAASSGAVVHDMGGSIGLHADLGPHGEEGVDPHWWLSPVLASRALAPLAERFAALDPAGAAGYRARAEETAQDLLRLDAEIA